MSEEIFGDKPAHQVSVSEGSGNAASSRNRSGKFKADTSRRINLDGDEGEMVSRHISSDGETHVTGGLGASALPSVANQPDHQHPSGVSTEASSGRSGPVQLREGLSDRSLAVSQGAADVNRQTLPGGEGLDEERIRIQAQAAADNLQVLPNTEAAEPNLARLPPPTDSQNRIALPPTDASDANKGPIIQAEPSPRAPSAASAGTAPAAGPSEEPSNYPHAAPLAKSGPIDHREGLTSLGSDGHGVPVDSAGLADRHVPLPGQDGPADNRQTVEAQALSDHREPLPGETDSANVQHLPAGDSALRQVDFGPDQTSDRPEIDANHDEKEALAPTHLDDGAEPALAEVGDESHPAPQAVKLQADLWREGFRGRVAQIREQVALIHENLDKLEK